MRIAVGSHYIAIAIQVERAGAGIGQLTRGEADLEESLALDDQVQRIVGLGELALGEKNLVRCRAGAKADLQAGRNHGLLAGGGTGLHDGLIEQVLELGTARLKASGIGVGQVVGDIIYVNLLRGHSAGSAIECTNHDASPSNFGDFLDGALVHLGPQGHRLL